MQTNTTLSEFRRHVRKSLLCSYAHTRETAQPRQYSSDTENPQSLTFNNVLCIVIACIIDKHKSITCVFNIGERVLKW